jgi:hypothetical protein
VVLRQELRWLSFANKSLDLTIDRLGRIRFEQAVAEFQRLEALETKVYAPNAHLPYLEHGRRKKTATIQGGLIWGVDTSASMRCL